MWRSVIANENSCAHLKLFKDDFLNDTVLTELFWVVFDGVTNLRTLWLFSCYLQKSRLPKYCVGISHNVKSHRSAIIHHILVTKGPQRLRIEFRQTRGPTLPRPEVIASEREGNRLNLTLLLCGWRTYYSPYSTGLYKIHEIIERGRTRLERRKHSPQALTELTSSYLMKSQKSKGYHSKSHLFQYQPVA